MQETHPTYDEFRFQIDEITHNPYHLISYFTSKYGQFTYEQVKDELEEIFREQYTLTTSGERGVTITETRTVHPGESLGEVTTSGHCSCEICCGPWAGGTTASGVYPMSNHTLAVDAFNPFVPIGTHVIMNGIAYVVEDTGAFDRFGVQFDVYYDDHQTALAHGHQTCEAYLAEGGGIDELELTITRTVDRMSVVLTNHDLDTVLQNRMTADEKVRYSLYNVTYGNRSYLFDLNNLPRYGNASRDYTIPPEALSDERFARMIAEAERHLGTPYVWGGYAPGGFDCSGFVCWVVNHCGNGWDIGRTTAEGIRQRCAYVSPEDARPGDIIFFEHTYDCAGASHVGIYVGDGMMIHCGEPVQYTSINSPYWQDHFMEFGRLP
jgi:3D (Asp-Asp-Asp) domain-containing protein